jgi:NADH dehydrogenase [ubiquinone] 1 alpha subcomplex assembly factor 5
MQEPPQPFDRRAVRRGRDRALRLGLTAEFLHREFAVRLVERLYEVKRDFPLALELGCRGGLVSPLVGAGGKVGRWILADLSPAMAAHCRANGASAVAADEEWLPFAPASFDLIVSCLNLHWTNDLPGALVQLRTALKPDGLLLASLFGAGTLGELRQALTEAEIEATGGARPRVSPFADARDAGALLQRAGFALPLVDTDTIGVTFADALQLMRELRAMGETNMLAERQRTVTRRAVVLGAAARYAAALAESDGRIRANFRVLNLTAWAPHPAQPKALRPGSAKTRLAAALGTEERPAGEAALKKIS